MTQWLDQLSELCVRFSPERGALVIEELTEINKLERAWHANAVEFLHRNERTAFGQEFSPLIDRANRLVEEAKGWVQKLNNRITGEEDGLPTSVIHLQNQMEDYYTFLSSRDANRSFTPSERLTLNDSLAGWDKAIDGILLALANNAEQMQVRIPAGIERWLKKVGEQLNMASDIRGEENTKLHTSTIAWMIQLLVKSGKEAPSEAWDRELHNLKQEVGGLLGIVHERAWVCHVLTLDELIPSPPRSPPPPPALCRSRCSTPTSRRTARTSP
jgi:hypothetical protein